jgi:hypothetical protein
MMGTLAPPPRAGVLFHTKPMLIVFGTLALAAASPCFGDVPLPYPRCTQPLEISPMASSRLSFKHALLAVQVILLLVKLVNGDPIALIDMTLLLIDWRK